MDAPTASEMLTVLQNVDQFYATSWNHLIICASVAFGLIGIVFPILIQKYQDWAMRRERQDIRSAIVAQVSAEVCDRMGKERVFLEEKIAAATKVLEERLVRDRAELEEGVRKTEENLRKEIAGAIGRVYHVQTNLLINEKGYRVAFHSGIGGLSSYIDAEDHFNLRRLLKVITDMCLSGMTKADVDAIQEDKEAFHGVLLRIKQGDVKGDFKDALDEAKRAFKGASERVPPAKTEGA